MVQSRCTVKKSQVHNRWYPVAGRSDLAGYSWIRSPTVEKIDARYLPHAIHDAEAGVSALLWDRQPYYADVISTFE